MPADKQPAATWRDYYHLTKPGIIGGNLLAAAAGFCLAARGRFDAGLLLAALGGLALVIASACVANNYLDRTIDRAMERTRQRAIAAGRIGGRQAILYAAALGLAGSVILAAFTNALCLMMALTGYLAYIVLYGIGKRRTIYGTLIGTIAGAMPPLVGYTAVTGRLDPAAVILFSAMVCWQLPHFYAIALYRLHDYTAAGLPVWPAVRGQADTRRQIIWSVMAFMMTAPLLTAFGYAGWSYFAIVLILGGSWLWRGLAGRRGQLPDAQWAKSMFVHSLIVLTGWCGALAGNSWLP